MASNAKSFIGIDFGNEACHVIVYKGGKVKTIGAVRHEDCSLRGTPSCVAFTEKDRIIGVAAKNQMLTNMTNTVFGFKRLLGKKFSDPYVQKELKHFPFKVEARPNDRIGIRVKYLGEDVVYSPEQITAMLFTKLKEHAENELKTPNIDCVVSVPSDFTNAERIALLDAASIAGLNVLRLMNETTAAALVFCTGIWQPLIYYRSMYVVFVDFGHSSLQVSSCEFSKESELRVLATATDSQCGGRDIDLALAEYFTQDFISRYKLDASKDQRTFLRLMQEVEKMKCQMSDISTRLPLNMELEGRHVTSYLQRSEMEQICQETFSRFKKTLEAVLHKVRIPVDKRSVEIVGGSSWIPFVKTLIEQVFGKAPCTTLNKHDAVPHGCALQCADLSPESPVFGKFKIIDALAYAVHLAWGAGCDKTMTFKEGTSINSVPCSKRLTLFEKEPFSVKAYYSDDAPYPDKLIGEWIIHVGPTPEGMAQCVILEVLVNHNCIIDVSAPGFNVEKKQDSTQNESVETQSNEDLGTQEPTETNAASQDQQNVPENQEFEKKQDSTRNESIETQSSEDLGTQEPTETNAASQDQQNVPENQEFEEKQDSTRNESIETQSSEDPGSQEPTETNAASQDQQNVLDNQEVKTHKTLIAGNEIACSLHKKEMEYIHELHKIRMENEKLKTVILNQEIELLNQKLSDVNKIKYCDELKSALGSHTL